MPASASPHGRKPRFSLSFRPILAETEEAAWTWAERILEQTRAVRAANGSRLDKRRLTVIAAETGALGNSTALVGTPEQVADALFDYHVLGVRTFLIRGFDPLEDAMQYGRDLLPAFRHLLARRVQTVDAA